MKPWFEPAGSGDVYYHSPTGRLYRFPKAAQFNRKKRERHMKLSRSVLRRLGYLKNYENH